MESKIGQLVEGAKQYAAILQRASSSEVASWKKDDVERAFVWARYFCKVLARVAGKPSVVSNIDIHLRQAGQRGGVRFGGEELCYAFLSDSSQYLLKALLENPALPLALRADAVLQGAAVDQGLQWHAYVETCAAEASLMQSLADVHIQLCQHEKAANSIAQGLLSTSADCYIEHLQWLLVFDSNKFQEQLKTLSQQTGGMEMLLTALLQCPTRPVLAAALQWLLSSLASEQDSHGVWDMEPVLLAKVSRCHTEFFEAHLQYLIGAVESSVVAGQEKSDGGFQRLCSHFSALLSCGPPVRDCCLSAITHRVPSKEAPTTTPWFVNKLLHG